VPKVKTKKELEARPERDVSYHILGLEKMVTVNSCGKKESQDLEGQGDALRLKIFMAQCSLASALGFSSILNKNSPA
jgi:hypothetical protein